MAASLALGFVRFDPRWTPLFWVWAPINLLLTCVSEEALFRGFLQRELGVALDGRAYAATTAVAVSALAFGLAHAGGGWRYVLLATLAGTGYALAYQRTRARRSVDPRPLRGERDPLPAVHLPGTGVAAAQHSTSTTKPPGAFT